MQILVEAYRPMQELWFFSKGIENHFKIDKIKSSNN